jgi:FeS assembly SUF system regulator
MAISRSSLVILFNYQDFFMIRLSRLADYAVLLLKYLASQPKDSLICASALATACSLPEPTASKVLKLLLRGNFLLSVRGTQGGYSLIRDAKEISIAEIISCIDGPIALTDCMGNFESVCSIEENCATRHGWRKVNDAVEKALAGIFLSDFLNQPNNLKAETDFLAPRAKSV